MKAWINKLGGVILASLLTVMLNGKAYADLDSAPEEPRTEIVEQDAPAAEPVVEASVENPVAAAPPAVEAVPAPVAPPVVEAASEAPAAAAEPVAEAVQEAAVTAAEPVAEPAAAAVNEAAPDVEPVVVESAVPAVESAVTEETIPDAVPAAADAAVSGMAVPEEDSNTKVFTEELTEDTAAPEKNLPLRVLAAAPAKTEPESDGSEGKATVETSAPLRKLSAESVSVVAASEPAAVEEEPAEPDALSELSTALRTAPLAKSAEDRNSEAPSGILRKLDDGTYIMVGYQDDSAAISTESPVLTVLAAGLNKISSLSSGGSIEKCFIDPAWADSALSSTVAAAA